MTSYYLSGRRGNLGVHHNTGKVPVFIYEKKGVILPLNEGGPLIYLTGFRIFAILVFKVAKTMAKMF